MSSISPTYKEASLRAYWIACQEIRHGSDKLNAFNDLYALAVYNEWPIVQHAAARVLAEPAPASVFAT